MLRIPRLLFEPEQKGGGDTSATDGDIKPEDDSVTDPVKPPAESALEKAYRTTKAERNELKAKNKELADKLEDQRKAGMTTEQLLEVEKTERAKLQSEKDKTDRENLINETFDRLCDEKELGKGFQINRIEARALARDTAEHCPDTEVEERIRRIVSAAKKPVEKMPALVTTRPTVSDKETPAFDPKNPPSLGAVFAGR